MATRAFYRDLLGCREGRSAERWVDFDFFGHQISVHLVDEAQPERARNEVDGDSIPVRHFGAILSWQALDALAARLEERGARFRIVPRIRFAGQPGEQATMFLDDPSGNVLELEAFRHPEQIFATAR